MMPSSLFKIPLITSWTDGYSEHSCQGQTEIQIERKIDRWIERVTEGQWNENTDNLIDKKKDRVIDKKKLTIDGQIDRPER